MRKYVTFDITKCSFLDTQDVALLYFKVYVDNIEIACCKLPHEDVSVTR